MLALETDYTKQSYGQILTRIEAFLESLGQAPERTKRETSRQQDGAVQEGERNTGKGEFGKYVCDGN